MRESYTPLPREVTALIHHIELNRVGWWDKTLNRLVLATVWITEGNVDEAKIIQALQSNWKLKVGQSKIELALESLIAEASLIRVSDKVYRIPEEARSKFEREISDAEKAEANARKYFCDLIEESCPGVNALDAWKAFDRICLTPMVRDIGANTYRLIVGERMTPSDSYADRFLAKFGAQHRGALRAVVPKFLDPKRKAARDHAMRLLHAYFCVEASGISGEVLDKLEGITGKRSKFRLFVDTNFLFSLLGLHENPSNASATELKELLANLKDNIQVDLFITPKTIDEAKRVIGAVQDSVSGIPVTDNFSGAALRVGISGMAMRFFTDIQRRKTPLTARDWFEPYLEDFVTVARRAGVNLFNEKLDEYGTRQDVVDDINLLMDHESRSRPEGKRKSYENVAHDVVLWHFVKDKRPAYVESPLDAQDWILTVDFRLIGFDERKCRDSKSNVPLCLHPTSLIQLLQFWMPRTQEFEEAVLGGLRLPFLFQEFDAKGERLSLEIIKQLGRFEDREAIPQETLVNVVMNDNLRSRINAGQPKEKEIELVRDELVKQVQFQAQQKDSKAAELKAIVEKKDETFSELRKEGEAKDSEIENLRRKLNEEEEKSRTADSKFSEMGEDIDRLKSELEQISQSRTLFGYLGLLATMVVLSVMVTSWLVDFAPFWLQDNFGTAPIKFVACIGVFVFLHGLLELPACRNQRMKQFWLFRNVRRFRKWLWGLVFWGLILSVSGNLVANWIQKNMDSRPSVSLPAPTAIPRTLK